MVGKLIEAIARRGISSAVSLLATSYLAHQLSKGELGAFVGMLALGQLLAVGLAFGFDATPAYLLRSHQGHSRRIIVVSGAVSLALAVACGLLGVLAQLLSLLLGGAAERLALWGLGPFAYAAGLLLLMPQLACLQGLLKLRSYNVIQVAYPTAYLLGLLVVDRYFNALSPSNAVLLWASMSAVFAVFAFLLVMRVQSSPATSPVGQARGNASLKADFVRFGSGVYGANLLGTLNSRLPGILGGLSLLPVAAGQFAGLIILNDIFSFFSFAIASVTFPLLAGREEGRERLLDLGRACRLNTTATLAAVVTFLLLFEALCKLLLGAPFVTFEYFLMCAAVLACTVIQSTARILCTDFASQGRPIMNAWLNVPALAVFVLGFWLLGETLQAWGAIASFAAASLCFSGLVFALHRRRSGLRFRDVALLTRDDLAYLGSLILARKG